MTDLLSKACRERLYRIMWQPPEGVVDAFAISASREEARRLFNAAVSIISGIHEDELELYNLESYSDLIDAGVSEDEELRVFETAWKGAEVTGWTARPLFLTSDATLLSKWAMLQADLAAQQARSAIARASGRA
jgi:hypothetical protein